MTKYRLNSGHVSALFKLRDAVRHYGRNSIHIANEMFCAQGAPFQLQKSEWTNFSFLRYHGLAVKDADKTGYWVLTSRGAAFLRGELEVPLVAVAENKHVAGHEGRMVSVEDFRRKLPKEFYEFQERPSQPPKTQPLFA